MEELKDVVLNVYSLSPTDAGSEPSSLSSSSQPATTGQRSSSSFLARLLPAVGLGAYHTELVLDGHHYTFAANAGIVKTAAVRLPVASAALQESIPLGACGLPRGEINAVVKKLGELYFKPNAYHLVHRNCNHFTETLATALILYDDLIESGGGNGKKNKASNKRLTTYPDWINRLASTSSLVVSHDEDIVPCRVWEEAAQAVGAGEKVGWSLDTSDSSKQPQSSKAGKSFFSSRSSNNKKKELSDKQKAILAKLRKK